MNTEQIMKLAVNFAEQFGKATPESFSNTYEALNSAIEALVQERDTYQHEADRLAAENKVLRDALEAVVANSNGEPSSGYLNIPSSTVTNAQKALGGVK